MKKILKLFTLLLVIPLLSIYFVGCKDKQEEQTEPEWVNVYSIEVFNGEKYTTYETEFRLKYETIEITEEEYNSLRTEDVHFDFSEYSLSKNIERYDNLKNVVTDKSKFGGKFYKNIISGYDILYVSVQIINDNTINIKDLSDNKSYQFNTSDYKITYFTD